MEMTLEHTRNDFYFNLQLSFHTVLSTYHDKTINLQFFSAQKHASMTIRKLFIFFINEERKPVHIVMKIDLIFDLLCDQINNIQMQCTTYTNISKNQTKVIIIFGLNLLD